MTMQYRTLGCSGLQVSVIALGCEGFVGKTDAESFALLDYAIAQGVNFVDIYSPNPQVRRAIGKALEGRRDAFRIQAHLGSVWKNGQYERTRDLAEIRRGFEALLKELGTDYLDVGMIHYSDEESDLQRILTGGIMDFACELKAAGRIRAIGLSSHNPVVARKAVEDGRLDALMFSVNPCYDMQPPSEDVEQLWSDGAYAKALHNFDSERESLYELCAAKGVGIDVMKVYGGGDLLKAELSPFGRAFTPVQALNYALTRPAVAAVMVGCKSSVELDAALAWCNASDVERDYSSVLAGLDKFTWSGHCMYCGHCAPCPVGISVADVNKYLNLAIAQGAVPETVQDHYRLLAHHASECVKCGACERRCPFGVPVRDRMDLAHRTFGV